MVITMYSNNLRISLALNIDFTSRPPGGRESGSSRGPASGGTAKAAQPVGTERRLLGARRARTVSLSLKSPDGLSQGLGKKSTPTLAARTAAAAAQPAPLRATISKWKHGPRQQPQATTPVLLPVKTPEALQVELQVALPRCQVCCCQ